MKMVKQPSLSLKPGKDGCGGHSWECQTAKSPIRDCVCACDGKNHGKKLLAPGLIPGPNNGFVSGLFYNEDTCIDCGGQLGPYVDITKNGLLTPVNPEDEWWIRECNNCHYGWAEWKLVARGFKPHV